MKLAILQTGIQKHTDVCAVVCWSPEGELYSCGDDGEIFKWSMTGDFMDSVCRVESNATDMDWFPIMRKSSRGGATVDLFVVGCVNGTFRFVSASGRLEAPRKAHTGAVTCVRWNHEGSALLTTGEDGSLKIWSRNGQLRSKLVEGGSCIYTASWNPENDHVLYPQGKDLIIRPLQPSARIVQWKAHEAPVLKTDWNPVTNLIVSGGEDFRFKIWDSYGRALYQSAPLSDVVTSVRWCPDGEYFAVGSYNSVTLCDKAGWAYCREKVDTGSLFSLAWSQDGHVVSGSGGNGSICFAQTVRQTVDWKNYHIVVQEPQVVHVTDVRHDHAEKLEFRDPVMRVSLQYSRLIIATTTQCLIYDIHDIHTPLSFDLKGTVSLIMQAPKVFMLVSGLHGVQFYTYDGRLLSQPKLPGIRSEFFNAQNVAISDDVFAFVDRGQQKLVRFFSVSTGKALDTVLKHPVDVCEIAMSNSSKGKDVRMVAFVDRNRDMYIFDMNYLETQKLATMVDCLRWCEDCDVLACISDDKLVTWLYPRTVFVDRDLAASTRQESDASEYGRNSQIIQFVGSHFSIRRVDGAVLMGSIAAYVLPLHAFFAEGKWEDTIRLCRFVKDDVLWSCLAAMAMGQGHLATAEVSYAALGLMDKLRYVVYMQDIPSQEAKKAELLIFQRRVDEAEALFLRNELYYRAIKMNIRLFRWERALEIALANKTHVDTVLGYRKRFLQESRKEETNMKFLEYVESVEVDWEKIKAKIQAEKEQEQERSGGSGH